MGNIFFINLKNLNKKAIIKRPILFCVHRLYKIDI